MHTHAMRIHGFGGPEVLSFERIALDPPGPHELLIRNVAIGVNFVDLQQRGGTFHTSLPLPATLGVEGSGVVEQVGSDIEDFTVGDRVAYFGPPFGAYAERRLYPAAQAVKLPPQLKDTTVAATLLKGITAYCLIHLAYPVERGDIILVHGAAGGVGVILSQWAASLGASVIGTVRSEEKVRVAQQHGCEYVIVLSRDDLASSVKEITGGQLASVVYDCIGKDTFLASLDCLRRRGTMVNYGAKSGPIPPIDPNLLMKKGSLVFTKTTNIDFTATRDELLSACGAVFGAIDTGVVRPLIHGSYSLRDTAQAHREIEARNTTGSVVLNV